jgi:hypothetical protein
MMWVIMYFIALIIAIVITIVGEATNKTYIYILGMIEIGIILIILLICPIIYPITDITEYNQQCELREHYRQQFVANGVWLQLGNCCIPLRKGESINIEGLVTVVEFTDTQVWPEDELGPKVRPELD